MNTLSNGSLAVGQERSWMRFQVAYEFELDKAYESGILRLIGDETIAMRAARMMSAIVNGNAIAGEAMKSAAKACGIKATEKGIREYLIQANPNR